MNIRSLSLTLVAGIALASTPYAQEPAAAAAPTGKPSAEERAKVRTAKMTEELGLDPQRTDAVYTINLRFVQAMDKAKATELPEGEMKARVKEIKDSRNVELKAVLTEEQFARLREWRDEKKEKGHEEKLEKKEHNE